MKSQVGHWVETGKAASLPRAGGNLGGNYRLALHSTRSLPCNVQRATPAAAHLAAGNTGWAGPLITTSPKAPLCCLTLFVEENS